MSEWLTEATVRDLLGGVSVTLLLTVVTSIVSLMIGVVITAGRLSHRPGVRLPATVFVEVFRNVPALIQIIFWAFAIPNLFPTDTRPTIFFDNAVMDTLSAMTGLPLPYYALAAGVGLSLNTGAHLADILRAGVGAIPVQQIESVRLLGAKPAALIRSVIVPSAIRTSFPAISTRLVHNMKNTALASFVAVPELFSEIQGSINKTFRATEFLIIAALVYLALSAVMTVALDAVDRRLKPGGPAAGRSHRGGGVHEQGLARS